MTIATLKELLLWSTLVNYFILLVWFGVFSFARPWLYGLHSHWFKLAPEQFDAIHYAGMAIYKIGVLLFNLAPLVALWLMGV